MHAQKIVTIEPHFRIGSGTTPRSQIPFTEVSNGGRLVSVETAIGPAVAVVNGNNPIPSHFYIPAAFGGLTTLPFVSHSTRSIMEVNVLRSDPVTDADIVRLTCERASSGLVPDIRRDLVAYFASNAPSGRLDSVHSSLFGVRRSHIASGGFAVAFEGSKGISSLLLCGAQPIADYARLSTEFDFAQGSGHFIQLSIDSLRFYRLTLAVFEEPSSSLGFLFVAKIQGASINRLGDESGNSMPLSEIFDVGSSLLLKPSSKLIPVAGYPYPLKSCVLCENSKDTPRYLVVDRDMEDPRIDLIIESLNSKGASIRKSDVMECTLSDGSVATFIPLDTVTKNLF